jgi:hypothetical protein
MSVLGLLKGSQSVWLGLVGSLSVGWASCQPEYSFDPGGWSVGWVNTIGRVVQSPVGKLMLVWGVLILLWAWWRLYEDRARLTIKPAIVLAIWSLPLLLVPSVLSQDAVLYADLGWTLSTGADPYHVGLAMSGGPFARGVDPLWVGQGVAYPPVSLLLDQAVVSLTGAQPYWSVVAMRIPAILSVAAMLWLVPRIAKRLGVPTDSAVILGVLNPLVVLHFIGGAHSDAPMVALVLLAVWAVVMRPAWWMTFFVAPAIVGLAICVKQQAGLAVVAVAGLPVAAALSAMPLPRRLWTLAWRTTLVTLAAVTTFVGLSVATGIGFGWTRWLDVMGRAGTMAPLGLVDSLWAIANGAAGTSLSLAGRPSTYVLAAVVVLILVRFADRPLAALGWGSFSVAVLGQALQPWYLPLGLVVLALVPITRRQQYLAFGFGAVFVLVNALQTGLWHGQ